MRPRETELLELAASPQHSSSITEAHLSTVDRTRQAALVECDYEQGITISSHRIRVNIRYSISTFAEPVLPYTRRKDRCRARYAMQCSTMQCIQLICASL